ncbi:hypothetical protein [Azoarcus sp. DN11]|uniref:hypothetical protein n=1 Tax=Azoarcus sp. DN11 TaxID=356837 RepID=UPI000EF2D340|nr:hypothetical protein [Azoarcus sp. DN11]AYH43530.1 hypothetical protein CDA09_09065 [Azoarcus sp. DN11]
MSFEVGHEFAPMSGIDEYMIHNAPAPQRVMWTSDPRTFERTWFTAQDKAGELFIVCGMGFYPNLDTADGFAIVTWKGRSTYVRYHRRLGIDRTNMRFGPLDWQIIAPFKTWKLTLGDNPHGIRYELYWHDTKRPVFSTVQAALFDANAQPGFPGGSVGKVGDHVGYEGFGVVEGWAEVEGKRIELTTETFRGSRDHHWGVRAGVGGFGTPVGRPEHAGQWVEFKDWSIWGSKSLRPIGHELQGAGRVGPVDRQLRFDADTGEFREGIITSVDEAGNKKELHFRRLGYQTAYLRCGGYGSSTPDGGGIHGIYPGEDTLYGGTLDLNDAATRMKLGFLADHHCEVSCGTETTSGMLECYEPLLKTMCEQGKPGYRFLK